MKPIFLRPMKFQAYLITCLVNGKRYVGITSRGLNRRWSEHLYDGRSARTTMAISRAISKHGSSNFTIQAVCSARSWRDICAAEAILIRQYGCRLPEGYNLSEGGEGPFGCKRSAESVERIAAKHRGKPCHPNTRLAGSRTHKGVPKSSEHRARISAAKMGKTRSDSVKEKIRDYWANRRAGGVFKTSRPYEHARKEHK